LVFPLLSPYLMELDLDSQLPSGNLFTGVRVQQPQKYW
jgi:hypothetical protein